MFHLEMGWNCSVHVSFRNGLESLRPGFVSQWAGIAPPMFREKCEFLSFAVDWILQPILSGLCVLKMWLGLPSYLYFSVAWSSELFVFRCGLEF